MFKYFFNSNSEFKMARQLDVCEALWDFYGPKIEIQRKFIGMFVQCMENRPLESSVNSLRKTSWSCRTKPARVEAVNFTTADHIARVDELIYMNRWIKINEIICGIRSASWLCAINYSWTLESMRALGATIVDRRTQKSVALFVFDLLERYSA